MSEDEAIPNERLRRARSLKGWSQADLAAHVGTSFEIVSRWERGVAVPGPYYRERLCTVLGKTAEELGLSGEPAGTLTQPSSPMILLVSAHIDAEKPIVAQLKTLLKDQGITLISSRQLGRQGRENARVALRAAIQSAMALLVILSPDASTSRHIREAFKLAHLYQLPIYGIWIEGERWQDYLPEDSATLVGVTDARTSTAPVLLREISSSLAQAGLTSQTNSSPSVISPVSSAPASVAVPLLPEQAGARGWREMSQMKAILLLGLALLVVTSTILGSVGVLAHLSRTGAAALQGVRGGVWIEDTNANPKAFLPDTDPGGKFIDQALYLPLFYGDAHGLLHPGAATEVPSLANGGISSDGTTWTFHLRPHLVWSDGQSYDARDVDYTWRLWLNDAFGDPFDGGLELIRTAVVSTDHLSITFHLAQAYASFLQYWTDGFFAPLPAHHFRSMTPAAIAQSPELLNPTVTSGPFMMAESVPGDHFTLIRNTKYYLADKGLPYLDKVIFRVAALDTINSDLQAGTITSTWQLDTGNLKTYERLTNYRLVPTPTSDAFEALYFNFRNEILSGHLEVRQAMAMAVDQPTLIQMARRGFASPLCTEHPSAVHPGFQPNAITDSECPAFDLAAANKLLDDDGWAKGADGVRSRNGQRLEFEYATTNNDPARSATEAILQRDFLAIGIKLDELTYEASQFFGSFLRTANPSPPTGAVSGRFDIAEYGWHFGYDPDDYFLFACDRTPPSGANFQSFCDHALDSLYQQSRTTVNPGLRQKAFDTIHLIYLKDLPFVVLFSPIDVSVARTGTHNYLPSPIDGSTIDIWDWWCDHGSC
jgi:peptide/nickel transport system substrate-binding protein